LPLVSIQSLREAAMAQYGRFGFQSTDPVRIVDVTPSQASS
jgi:hypothetical protein